MYYIINTIKQLASRPSLGTNIVPKTSPQRAYFTKIVIGIKPRGGIRKTCRWHVNNNKALANEQV
ncbi:hypothetical protein E2C01_031686 [Portunus trituberculatus]|uniref:Uncharacterized protein n=1 Tax=Portunus trituberculatus TaxID=210409 RepID=A0A5B7EZ90_PORTR|nr:hypothetical protein [Portunus trituberculatus]